MPDSPRIYVSYRRSDTGLASRFLTDKLATYFGTDRVFSDIDSIEPGENFSEAIAAAIRSCSVLLVVIGSSWLSVVGEGARRRLDDPDDVVRTIAMNYRLFCRARSKSDSPACIIPAA